MRQTLAEVMKFRVMGCMEHSHSPKTQSFAIREIVLGSITESEANKSHTAKCWMMMTDNLWSLNALYFTVAIRMIVSPKRDERRTNV
jgi:hypothetical protein